MADKKKLTDSAISKSTSATVRDTEIRGFVVITRKTGKFFYLEYKSPIDGRYKKHPLGKWGETTTSLARENAKIATGQIAKGEDPQQQKKEKREKLKMQSRSTLRNFLETDYLEVTPKKTADKATKTIQLHFKDLLDKPMNQILPVEIEKWQVQYKGKPSGANRILTDLRAALTKAVNFNLLDVSPIQQVKKLKEDKTQEIRYLTKQEEARLLEAIDLRQEEQRAERLRYIEHCKTRNSREVLEPHGTYTDYIKPIVITVLNTGIRPGELFNLRASAINNEARLLTVRGDGSKTGQTRQIFLNDLVFNTLTTWLRESGNTGYVFPSPQTGGRLDNISSAWDTVRSLSGLPDLVLYNLRHTFATRLAHNRVDLVTIKELMGHESLDITEKYLHTSNELKLQAVAGLIDG